MRKNLNGYKLCFSFAMFPSICDLLCILKTKSEHDTALAGVCHDIALELIRVAAIVVGYCFSDERAARCLRRFGPPRSDSGEAEKTHGKRPPSTQVVHSEFMTSPSMTWPMSKNVPCDGQASNFAKQSSYPAQHQRQWWTTSVLLTMSVSTAKQVEQIFHF